MVFVKVRETYDLHTVQNKMTVIAIHTPHPDIIKANFPGLLLQCRAYRPVSADVRVACASVLPLDPQGVGLAEGDVAPEDIFNPILYKACSNFGMSQIEARINMVAQALATGVDVAGNTAGVDVDTLTSDADEFPVYYGLLSNAHEFRHANPQQGLEMKGLKPLVYEILYNMGDNALGNVSGGGADAPGYPAQDGSKSSLVMRTIRGSAKPLPFINCTSYSTNGARNPFTPTGADPGNLPANHEIDVPWINCVVGAIIIPPSRLHELFYRMVIEWTIEFTAVRPIGEIASWSSLGLVAGMTHYQNYSFEATKKALGVESEVMDYDQTMVSANVEIEKVM